MMLSIFLFVSFYIYHKNIYLNIEDALFIYIYHELYRFEASPQWKTGWGNSGWHNKDVKYGGTYIATNIFCL